MKTRAAIAWAAGEPLEVIEVDLDGPKAGEVLVEVRATGVCHTDEFTRSGADPEGLFPAIFGHEGAGVVVDVGAGVKSVRKGDHGSVSTCWLGSRRSEPCARNATFSPLASSRDTSLMQSRSLAGPNRDRPASITTWV